MKTTINKEAVDGAQPGPRDRLLWDTDLRGFGLKITPSGRKVYLVQYRLGGRKAKTQRYTIGKHGSPWTPAKARDEAKRLLGLVANKIDPAKLKRDFEAAHQAESEAPTLAAFAARYMEEHARPYKKPRSVEEDERNLRLHILPALGRLKLKDVTAADIARFHARRKATPTNSNRCRALLSHLFKMAEVWNERPSGSNPCQHVKKYHERKRERFLSPEEFARLGDALLRAEEEESPQAIAAIRLLVLTGCRLSEILGLEWDWVDFDRSCLRLPVSKGHEKVVPLGAPALSLLADLPRQDGSKFVCPAERGAGHFVGIQRVWQRVRQSARLEDVRLHDLRHSFASVAVAAGDSLYLVGKILGHRQTSTTERYAHLRDDPLRAVVDRTSGSIAAIMRGAPAADVVALRSGRGKPG